MDYQWQLKYIGKFIFSRRLGMSQVELAKKAGISQQQLSKIEAGGNCTMLTLLKILAALGEKIEIPISPPPKDNQIEIIKDYPYDYF
jgi:predicted transcriptional regulator